MFAVISIMIIVSGAVSMLIGLSFFVGTIRFLRIAERAAGVIVGNEIKVSKESDGTRTSFLHPVVEFEDGDGRKHRITLATGTAGVKPFPPGSQVEVLYPPDNPERAMIRHFLYLWFFPMGFAATGVVAVVFGCLFHAWTSDLR